MNNNHARIILVDQDRCSSQIAQFSLEQIGQINNVSLFTHPENAMSEVLSHSCETTVILGTGFSSSSMDEFEFLEELQKLSGNLIKVFIAYAVIFEEEKQKFMQYPIVKGFIEKPLLIDAMREPLAL